MSQQAETPPVDLRAFRVSMSAAGIEEIVEPTLALFVQESVQLVAGLETAIATSDFDGVRRAAHTLKGSSGNVRARALAQAAEVLERTAMSRDGAAAAPLIAAVLLEHAAVVDYLSRNGIA